MTTLTRRYRFCASHRLHSDALNEAENSRIYGKCNNPYGHGHDYTLDVSVTGEVDEVTGLVVRLAVLNRLVEREILARFGHRNLNADVEEFAHLVPTTENLAMVIASELNKRWDDYFPYSAARLSSIFIQETDRNGFEVILPERISQRLPASIEANESVVVNV